jgi:hypothetical protein
VKLEEIRKLCDEATPGPWGMDWHNDERTTRDIWRSLGPIVDGKERVQADAAFIAMARTALPKLLAVAEAANAFCRVETLEPWDGEAEEAYQSIRKALAALEADDGPA